MNATSELKKVYKASQCSDMADVAYAISEVKRIAHSCGWSDTLRRRIASLEKKASAFCDQAFPDKLRGFIEDNGVDIVHGSTGKHIAIGNEKDWRVSEFDGSKEREFSTLAGAVQYASR